MLTFILFAVSAIFLLGTAVLVHGLMTSVEGYQDELGFHEGVQPQHRVSTTTPRRKSGHGKSRASPKRRAHKSRELEFAA
jgi:hypothetical protein